MQNTLTLNGDVVTLGNLNFRRKLRWYSLSLVRTAVVSAIFSGQILIDPNLAPFLCLSTHIGDTADGTAITSQEDFFVNAQDNENGYTWCDGFVPRTAFAGTREFGYNLPDAWAIRANTRITFQVQNKAVAPTAGTATITLRGWQLIPV
jgi:hypothetical protein